ncbi:glycerophosphodiester phosphodiesterase [Parasphingopyxis algicola]|uniref:glycerophosphodiester phosphodiesterase family protein n=1 Tax=Parasphingopyxis algicola TaxID=2026624 RepID=UPI0015A46162|nr:glycerophosphodiester phosphodiesterase family protein [Parasphingopyxis algicola]QLC25295.1 glycerophosphodiester phosphodiesterase [Parasphingopyxis algicola]
MADLGFLTRAPFAHRGLHGAGVVENSRAAFEAAIAAGHGIETDVQVSKDGVAMVFHDYELDRLTRKTGPVIERKAAKLAKIKFKDSDETVPRLTGMLDLVAGRAPVLIELKAKNRKVKKLCRSVADALADYDGEAAVMSFNPEVGRWFARNAPSVVRGLVVTEHDEVSLAARLKGPMQRSLSVFRAEPHFLAYDIRDLPSTFADSLREKGVPVVTWTVRTDGERACAAKGADQIIYENP